MARLRIGWLVALFAAIVSVSVWLPWLTSTVDDGGHVSAIGGRVGSLQIRPGFSVGQLIVLLASTLLVMGAMVGRGLWAKAASVAALIISLLIAALIIWYHHLNVAPPVAAGYGLYVGAAGAVGAVGSSAWVLISIVLAGGSVR